MANVNIGVTKDFTPSDSTEDRFNMFMVTSASGSVSVGLEGGDVVTLAVVPVGVWVPCGNAIRIQATGTDAVGIMVV